MSNSAAEEQLKKGYQILNPLGDGSFGYILAVRNRESGQLFACKIEKHHGKTILVQKQFQIMFSLYQYPFFPSVYEIQKFKEHSYLIMEKLDHTLSEHFTTKNKKFSLSTIALLTDQCFTTLKLLHEAGYLHRDLKPQNFMINNNSHQLKLIDFGLADGTRVKRASMLIGNVRFSSRGAHFGVSSQKDDLESLIYVLYHLLAGELPWENATKTDIELEINRKSDQGTEVNSPILIKKYAFLETLKFPQTKNEIKKVVYSEYSQLMKYVMELEVDGEPDYEAIQQRCERLLLLSGARRGDCFDWCTGHCAKRPRGELWDVFQGK